jgi:enoyl-CoA hydratase/carnithine racemase
MSATARIGLPEIQFGLIPGGGGTQRLPRLVGIAAAKEMIFLGLDKTAEEALRIGLVNKVVAPDALMPSCVALARELALRPGYALAAAKRAINAGMDMKLADALNFERETHVGMGTPEERKMARDAAASKNATYAKIFGQNDTLL